MTSVNRAVADGARRLPTANWLWSVMLTDGALGIILPSDISVEIVTIGRSLQRA